MPTVVGRPGRSAFGASFADDLRRAFREDAIRARGFVLYADENDEPATTEPAVEPVAVDQSYVPTANAAARYAAVADAMGDDGFEPEPERPEPSYAAQDAEPAVPEPTREPEAQSRAYVVREGNWRERHGIHRKKKTVPPSRTPEARRLRHLQKLVEAGKFASIHEAHYGAPKRQSFGKPRPRKDKTE